MGCEDNIEGEEFPGAESAEDAEPAGWAELGESAAQPSSQHYRQPDVGGILDTIEIGPKEKTRQSIQNNLLIIYLCSSPRSRSTCTSSVSLN